MLAMAMQESKHMNARQRHPCIRNWTIFNLSVDFIEMTGYYDGGRDAEGRPLSLSPERRSLLNTDAGLPEAVGILECAFARWGIENTLAFVRQGRSGFDPQKTGDWRMQCNFYGVAGRDRAEGNTLAYNICEYLQCIKRAIRYIDENPAVWDNEERPDIPCKYI